MRIAHFLVGRPDPDAASGVRRVVYDLARAQAASGDDVLLLALASAPPAAVAGVLARAYAPRRLPFALPARLLEDLRAWRPDVVHLHSGYVPPNAALAVRLRRWRVPYVVSPHGALSPHIMRRRPHLKWPYRMLVERPLLNRAAFVHAASDDGDVRRYGVTTPIVVAPNAVDLGSVPRDLDPRVLARRFPAVVGRRRFMFLGRLDPFVKGLDVLLEAFRLALAFRRDLVLVLVGPDWRGGERRLRERAARLGMGGDVVFWGAAYGRERFDLLAGSDVFVLTSRSEGAPLSVLEALACGRPCLVSRRADPMGLIAASGAGMVVEPTVEGVMEGLVGYARSSPEALAEQGARARRLVERELSWRRTADALRGAYRRAAGG